MEHSTSAFFASDHNLGVSFLYRPAHHLRHANFMCTKRQRNDADNYTVSSPAWIHSPMTSVIISQLYDDDDVLDENGHAEYGSASVDDCMDITYSPPAAKRRRIMVPSSHGLSSPMGTVSVTSSSSTVSSSAERVEWWKQSRSTRKTQQMLLEDQEVVCFACETVFNPQMSNSETDNRSLVPVENVMPTNSLLQYFTSSSSSRKMSTKASTQKSATPFSAHMNYNASVHHHRQRQRSKKANCTYCERSACPNCLRQCEACHDWFCLFCYREDYYGAYTRILCSECLEQQPHNVDHHDEETMNMQL